MHIPTDAEEQEAANTLNEHSYANIRNNKDKLSDDESSKAAKDEVKVSEYVMILLLYYSAPFLRLLIILFPYPLIYLNFLIFLALLE